MKKGSFTYKIIYNKESINLANVSEVVIKNVGSATIYFSGMRLFPGEQTHPIGNHSIIDFETNIYIESTDKLQKAHLSYIQHPPNTSK